jgi:hypothetical protein
MALTAVLQQLAEEKSNVGRGDADVDYDVSAGPVN